MVPDLTSLSDRECQVLRLLARGHEAKSVAIELGLSVHTINERLRSARRKLGAASSREAARMLAAADRAGPENLGYEELGVAGVMPSASDRAPRHGKRQPAGRVFPYVIGTSLMIFVTLSAIAFWLSGPAATAAPRVLHTVPAGGTKIASGPFVLAVTFDRPMRADSYSFVETSRDTYPDCATRPDISSDRRTFTLRCKAAADRTYHVGFNDASYRHFESVQGVAAMPFRLTFTTRR